MHPASKILYWFTPFSTRQDLQHFLNQFSAGNAQAFFCYDSRWNRVNREDLKYLKNELQKHGVHLFMMEGPVEKTVPSAARVLKAEKVVCPGTGHVPEFEIIIQKICRDLELHSIAFCHPFSRFSFYNRNEFDGLRHNL